MYNPDKTEGQRKESGGLAVQPISISIPLADENFSLQISGRAAQHVKMKNGVSCGIFTGPIPHIADSGAYDSLKFPGGSALKFNPPPFHYTPPKGPRYPHGRIYHNQEWANQLANQTYHNLGPAPQPLRFPGFSGQPALQNRNTQLGSGRLQNAKLGW
jgi:hypothetical protein